MPVICGKRICKVAGLAGSLAFKDRADLPFIFCFHVVDLGILQEVM